MLNWGVKPFMCITIKKILSSANLGWTGVVVGSLSSTLVWSQPTPALEEVVVTAQMREEQVQTPHWQSVSITKRRSNSWAQIR